MSGLISEVSPALSQAQQERELTKLVKEANNNRSIREAYARVKQLPVGHRKSAAFKEQLKQKEVHLRGQRKLDALLHKDFKRRGRRQR